jgi:replicative DNA helicase
MFQDKYTFQYDSKNNKDNDFIHIFHNYYFRCIKQLAVRGYKTVTKTDLYNIIESISVKKPEVKSIMEENNWEDFYNTFVENVEVENFDDYYNEVKRMSLLRDLAKDGYDISEFFDIDNNKDLSSGMRTNELLEKIELKTISLKRKYNIKKIKEEYKAGTDFAETKERNKKEPLIGDSFQSPSLNEILRGVYGFIIRVGKTGGGKSVFSIGDLCKTTCKEYWDYDKKCFVINKSRTGAGLFINTEMDIRNELDPLYIAWISGVERSHILDGEYYGDEEERVDYARKILCNSDLYIVDDPEFTTRSLIETLRYYKQKYGIRNACFDYIQNNGYIAKEISLETKIPQREDMVLLALTDRLKQEQRALSIGLLSAVQSNGNEDKTSHPDEGCMAGGKAQARKTNATIAQFPPTNKELEVYEMIRQKPEFKYKDLPLNNVIHILKSRSSKYPKYCKIFQYADTGTARTIDLAVLEKNNQPIPNFIGREIIVKSIDKE